MFVILFLIVFRPFMDVFSLPRTHKIEELRTWGGGGPKFSIFRGGHPAFFRLFLSSPPVLSFRPLGWATRCLLFFLYIPFGGRAVLSCFFSVPRMIEPPPLRFSRYRSLRLFLFYHNLFLFSYRSFPFIVLLFLPLSLAPFRFTPCCFIIFSRPFFV